jgi:hypothetical protein
MPHAFVLDYARMANDSVIAIDEFQFGLVHGGVVDHGTETMQTKVGSENDRSVGSSELRRGGYVFSQ